ncbi:PAS domain-containing protein [Thalassovita sp.]|uniref:PAS domain-containing protein n=1 Tax=Thalassovita sp. TaxID=1979401 RepID=UPI0029DE7304|nr:PAS domain-containing protein [Thalassovita sp.]
MFFSGDAGGNVVDIGGRLARGRYPEIVEVEAYWNALRGSRLVPGRLEIDPRGIEGALACAFIVERIAPGVARVRLAGSQVNDLMGMDLRGMPLSALIAPQHRKRCADYLDELFCAPARLTMDLSAERALGKPRCDGRMVLLPLTDGENRITRALGVLPITGAVGRAPRRFTLQAQRLAPLTGATLLRQATPPPRPAQDTPRPPHLRLVTTGD